MFRISLRLRGTGTTIVIVEKDRDIFSNRIKNYVGPNSGWYAMANGWSKNAYLPIYVDRFWDEFIDSCHIEAPQYGKFYDVSIKNARTGHIYHRQAQGGVNWDTNLKLAIAWQEGDCEFIDLHIYDLEPLH